MNSPRHDYPSAVTVNGAYKPQLSHEQAVRWVIQKHEELGGKVLLLIPHKGTFASMNNLLTDFGKLSDVTVDTMRGGLAWSGGVVLAAWPARDSLAAMADDHRVRALCVIPWDEDSTKSWEVAYKPHRLGGDAAPSVTALDPVVVVGLTQLTGMVNHANNLVGALDHRDAVAVLKLLHTGGYALPHDAVYEWALVHGWPARGAERLREMAAKIDAGRVVQMKGTSPLVSGTLTRWQEKASESAS